MSLSVKVLEKLNSDPTYLAHKMNNANEMTHVTIENIKRKIRVKTKSSGGMREFLVMDSKEHADLLEELDNVYTNRETYSNNNQGVNSNSNEFECLLLLTDLKPQTNNTSNNYRRSTTRTRAQAESIYSALEESHGPFNHGPLQREYLLLNQSRNSQQIFPFPQNQLSQMAARLDEMNNEAVNHNQNNDDGYFHVPCSMKNGDSISNVVLSFERGAVKRIYEQAYNVFYPEAMRRSVETVNDGLPLAEDAVVAAQHHGEVDRIYNPDQPDIDHHPP
eukprot:Pgem_evm2s9581